MTKPLLAMDWDGKAVHTTTDGETVVEVKRRGKTSPMLVLLERLDRPHRVVVEASFESYAQEGRADIIRAYADAGHELLTINQRMTAWWRVERGVEKSNAADARAIYALAAEGKQHLKVPALYVDKEWADRRDAAEYELMVLRRTDQQAPYARHIVKLLPKFTTLDEQTRLLLGGKGGYSLALVATSAIAVKYTRNRREWERLLGLSGSGKNSQFRSNLYYHHLKPRLVHEPVLKPDGTPELTDTGRPKRRVSLPVRLPDGMEMADWRRSLRWLHRQLRDAPHLDGMAHPASAGICDPRGGAHA